MMNTKPAAAVCAALLSLTTLVGCGDDNDTLSATEYRTQGNAICRAADPEIATLFADLGAKGDAATPEDLQVTVDGLLDLVNGEIDDLAALAPPKELAADATAMLDAARQAVAYTEAQGLGFFEDETNPFAQVDKLALELGLTACGEG